jgi:tRNA(Ile)-lysidine synthase
MKAPQHTPFMIVDKIKETIKKHRMLSPGDRVLVAVSGGPDSVCLLRVLQTLAKKLDLTLQVAHLDHMFRGKESADEAQFVADLAKKLGIPATLAQIDVPAFCRERGLSAQEGAREVRYGFLRRVADETGSSRIAVGHTAEDQAETFMMRLLRGAGTSGLSAIPPVRDNIIRPLIDVTRKEVLEYLKKSEINYVTDPSNTKPVYTRNRVRLELMPVLKRFNPRIVETLAAEANLLRDEDVAIERHCAALAESILVREENDLLIKRTEFNILPPAFKRRLLKKASDLAGVRSSGLSRDQIDEAVSFMAAARTGRTMDLPSGLTIGREYDSFYMRPASGANTFCLQLSIPGLTTIPELGLAIETGVRDRAQGNEKGPEDTPGSDNFVWQALFDYDKMGSLLTLRSRQKGDRFYPAGMGGKSKKIQDYFVDQKVPRRKRDTIPLLCSGQDILWVVGLRTDERFLPGPNTKRVLVVRVRHL